MNPFDLIVAVVIGVVIWRASRWVLGILVTPPPEVDPEEVVEVDQDYRCSVCGTEVTVRVANLREASPPRHCREDMDPVPRSG